MTAKNMGILTTMIKNNLNGKIPLYSKNCKCSFKDKSLDVGMTVLSCS